MDCSKKDPPPINTPGAAVAALVEGVSGVGTATASIRKAQPMAVSMGEQAEVGAFGAPMAGAARPIMSSTSQVEAARSDMSSVQVAMFTAGRTEEGAPEASSGCGDKASLRVCVTCPLYR